MLFLRAWVVVMQDTIHRGCCVCHHFLRFVFKSDPDIFVILSTTHLLLLLSTTSITPFTLLPLKRNLLKKTSSQPWTRDPLNHIRPFPTSCSSQYLFIFSCFFALTPSFPPFVFFFFCSLYFLNHGKNFEER